MTKSILTLIVLIALCKQNFSQTSKDSIRVSKNEIGTNLIPAIKYLSGSNGLSEQYKYSLQYKRFLSKHLYARLSVSTIFYNTLNQEGNYSAKLIFPESVINAGLEYRWGAKRLKYFTGMDLGYTYTKTKYLDKTSLDNYINVKNGATITPFFGAQYHFSNRFFFSMQLGPELGIVSGKRSSTPNIVTFMPLKYTEYSISRGILSSFSLFYKF